MNVLITGGTGLIGKHLCAKLKARGDKVFVLTRNVERAQKTLGEGVECSSTLDKFKRVPMDCLVNLAGERIDGARWNERFKKKLLDSRLQVTQECVDFIRSVDQKPVFISGSAIGFYGESQTQSFDESTSPEGGFTHELCSKWEACARQVEDQVPRLVMLRTGVVMAKHDGALKKMLPAFKMGVGGKVGRGSQWFSWIHLEDMVSVILFCMDNPVSGPINATAPNPVNQLELAKTLGRVLRRPTLFPLPSFMVKFMFGEMGQTLLLEGQKVIPKALNQSEFVFQYPNLEEALTQLLK